MDVESLQQELLLLGRYNGKILKASKEQEQAGGSHVLGRPVRWASQQPPWKLEDDNPASSEFQY